MPKTFKLVGVKSGKMYMESKERPELQRWLDEKFGSTYSGMRGDQSEESMPEAMKIVYNSKGLEDVYSL